MANFFSNTEEAEANSLQACKYGKIVVFLFTLLVNTEPYVWPSAECKLIFLSLAPREMDAKCSNMFTS